MNPAAPAMSEQEAIILACTHPTTQRIRLAGGRRVYCCANCWARSVEARKAADLEAGRAFWAARGIRPGDRVARGVWSMLGGGGMAVYGTAKVGAGGAYVSAPQYQRGKLTPEGWTKCD